MLAGAGEAERLPAESYSRAASHAVYAVCFERAERALAAGHSVVLDAVFAEESERRSAAELARRTRAHFTGVWLDAPADVLIARVASRQGDASDATPSVVEKQMRYDLGLLEWQRIDATGAPAATLARVREMLPFRAAARA